MNRIMQPSARHYSSTCTKVVQYPVHLTLAIMQYWKTYPPIYNLIVLIKIVLFLLCVNRYCP